MAMETEISAAQWARVARGRTLRFTLIPNFTAIGEGWEWLSCRFCSESAMLTASNERDEIIVMKW